MKTTIKTACIIVALVMSAPLLASVLGLRQHDRKRKYNEQQVVSLNTELCSAFAEAGFSKKSIGAFDQLPLELSLYIVQLVGTKLNAKSLCLLKYPTVVIPYSEHRIIVARGETVKLLNLDKALTRIKTLRTESLYATDGNTVEMVEKKEEAGMYEHPTGIIHARPRRIAPLIVLPKGRHCKIHELYRPLANQCPLVALPNNRIALGCWDDAIRIYDINSGACTQTLFGHNSSMSSLVHVSNAIIASSSWDKTVKVWDIDKGTCMQTVPDVRQTPCSLVALPHNRLAWRSRTEVYNEGHHIKIWDIDSGTYLPPILLPHAHHGNLISLSGDRLAVDFNRDETIRGSSMDYSINIWDLKSGKWIKKIPLEEQPCRYAELTDNQLAVSHYGGTVTIWNIDSGNLLRTFHCDSGVNLIVKLPNNRFLLTCWDTSIMKLYAPMLDCDHRIESSSSGVGISSLLGIAYSTCKRLLNL